MRTYEEELVEGVELEEDAAEENAASGWECLLVEVEAADAEELLNHSEMQQHRQQRWVDRFGRVHLFGHRRRDVRLVPIPDATTS